MEPLPFAGFNPRPSPWGYSWTTENVSFEPPKKYHSAPLSQSNGPKLGTVTNNYASPPETPPNQYVNMPAALISSLKREKKPFTYTPGGVNLSEVLNARLQKRIERKKKSSIGHMSPETNERISSPELPNFDPPKQVIVMPTYNTPLDMYSMENAIEALEVQAELAVADKGHSSPSRSATLPRNHTFRFDVKDFDPGRNVAQSKAFKVLQIITDTEEEPPVNDRSGKAQFQDEMRFTGIRESKTIPSKFFHNLQRITGTEEGENAEEVTRSREMERKGAPKSVTFEKQTARPGFLPQHNTTPVAQVSPKGTKQPHSVSQFQPLNKPNPKLMEQQRNNSPLRRPAAFLPAKTGKPTSSIKSVQPPILVNGGPRRVFNPSVGTDF